MTDSDIATTDPSADDRRIGARLRGWRESGGLSVADLAAAAGLPAHAVQAYEGGASIPAAALGALAAALEIAADDLLGIDGPGTLRQGEAALAYDYFIAIPDPRLRRAALTMLAGFADAP